MTTPRERLPYNPEELERELTPFYISASDEEISQMLEGVGANELKDLFNHLNKDILFKEEIPIGKHLGYDNLVEHVEQIASKNNLKTSFLGDGLAQYKVPEIVPYVCNIRGLTTAYTPYQPERSQGTLKTLWLYSSSISMLTGFEAINASLYDRSTCLYEAINTAIRIKRSSDTVIVASNIYPGDIEVLETLAKQTKTRIIYAPVDAKTGLLDQAQLVELVNENKDRLAGIAFPQVNNLGLLEDIHSLTDICHENSLQSIAIIDPILLSSGGLIPPSKWGSNREGTSMFVGEGQHLAIGPNFGGPGLGIFGIRYNDQNKTAIRSSAGRFVGKTKDASGKECLCMVLSTREQHIRREKATSNICSNQSFVASAAGAAILGRGEKGMTLAIETARNNALKAFDIFTSFEGFSAAKNSEFFNELAMSIPVPASKLIEVANKSNIHIGVDITSRINDGGYYILTSFFDIHTDEDLKKLESFLASNFKKNEIKSSAPAIRESLLRKHPVNFPNFTTEQLKEHYDQLGDQNVSPDDAIYPLGSCTMKYNPYINDYTASLQGFTDVHPQAPEEDTQGCLEILYQTQEIFKGICGMPGCVTQPVAGAQGELVGIKMFQAYHADKGNAEKRNIILIPKTAHGTNPATATMSGLETKIVDGIKYGIIPIDANTEGQIDFDQLQNLVKEYGERICGIMVTNPNTSGIFENKFKEMAELIHSVDGLVYMDGANMNAIAGWVDLGEMGVDAVHNNLHKTWTIPHGGGGPGDAIVAVSEKLIDFMPGMQVKLEDGIYKSFKPSKTIGSFHRHHGNFAHKVRAYTYLKALGAEGVKKMAAVAVLSAQYLYENLKETYPSLPAGADHVKRMHEFILTISDESFARIAEGGTPKAQAVAKMGKLYLDFGMHAPTVAFPEVYGLMFEPTESFTKGELDRFIEVVKCIHQIIHDSPEVLVTAPHFTPVQKVDEVMANKNLNLSEKITDLGTTHKNIIHPGVLGKMSLAEICKKITQ